jgi:hypothetical protein
MENFAEQSAATLAALHKLTGQYRNLYRCDSSIINFRALKMTIPPVGCVLSPSGLGPKGRRYIARAAT